MIQRGLLAFGLILIGSFGLSFAFPQTALADHCSDKGRILTLKPWYSGLTDAECNIKFPSGDDAEMRRFVWTIGLNVVEDLLQVVGYIAVAMIIAGGFMFMTCGGVPEKAKKARNTIINASIGLVVAITAVLLVNLVARVALGIQ